MKLFVGDDRRERLGLVAVAIVTAAVMLAGEIYDERAYLLVYALLAIGYVRGRVLRRRESRS